MCLFLRTVFSTIGLLGVCDFPHYCLRFIFSSICLRIDSVFFLSVVSTGCLRFPWRAWSLRVCLWFIHGVISVILSPSRFDSIFIVGFLRLLPSLTIGFSLSAACGALTDWAFFLYSYVALPTHDVVLIHVLSVCWLDYWLPFSLPAWCLHALSAPWIL